MYATGSCSRVFAIDVKTGDVVWIKKMENYKEGYPYTTAPLIVNGKVVVGNSGGEFGIVGAVSAYDAETGDLMRKRPMIEGHMGMLNGKESTMTGTLNATWSGDMWKTRGAFPASAAYAPVLPGRFVVRTGPCRFRDVARLG